MAYCVVLYGNIIASETVQQAVVPSSPRASPRAVIPVRARVRSSSSGGSTAQPSTHRVRKMCSDTDSGN